ncbi:MAG: tRNA-intron lyase [Crenarchaeota archaeon]|nr:tRNA-intron lyase [Thermoproteota archaeon]MCR8453393.1 tRNA-intron lyase [Thermoproteota archaeon]MCR8455704.1 tRNA-intron lyase [Thermoproteota archaeon]MCR8462541.1 tRNA-intron lyase [Thermoproteota archaeon]MCR8472791.1 tRNA-intron lyase [Thermoproteota archaeon]
MKKKNEKDVTYLSDLPDDLIDKRLKEFEAIKQANIEAHLVGRRIVVCDAQAGFILHKNGFFGKPLGIRKPKLIKYNTLYELSFYEALYLLENKAITIKHNDKELSAKDIREIAAQMIDDFEAKYRVYCDLRSKGFIVKTGLKYGADFVVYVYGPGIDHSPFVVSVFSPNTELRGQDFLRAGRLSWSVRKRWILACVYNDNIGYLMFEWNKDLST